MLSEYFPESSPKGEYSPPALSSKGEYSPESSPKGEYSPLAFYEKLKRFAKKTLLRYCLDVRGIPGRKGMINI